MDFLKKIQSQPESTRKVILWVAITIISVLLFSAWIWYSARAIKNASKSNLLDAMKLDELQTEIQGNLSENDKGLEEASKRMDDILGDEEFQKALEEEISKEEEK